MAEHSPYVYDVEVEWLKDREGVLRSEDLQTLEVSSPPEFHGRQGVWTPEHLFVASVNSCFMLTFLAIAKLAKLEFTGFDSRASGKLERGERSFQFTEIVLRPRVIISQQEDREKAQQILERAEKKCLVSNSIKTQIRMECDITVSPHSA